MAGCVAEHHASKVGLGETGDTAPTGSGITQGVCNALLGGSAGNPTVWVGDVGHFVGNGEGGGRDAHWVPLKYHGEAITEVRRKDTGDARGGRSAIVSGNAVDDDLHRETVENCGTVGGNMPTI